MDERSVASELVRKATEIVLRSGADRAVSVGVRLGERSGVSEPHLRSQFAAAAEGTPLEDALLDVTIIDRSGNGAAAEVMISHVEVADPSG